MRLCFQCEKCSALHKDPDACNKCKHTLGEEIDLEAQSAASSFVTANKTHTLLSVERALGLHMEHFVIAMMRRMRG